MQPYVAHQNFFRLLAVLEAFCAQPVFAPRIVTQPDWLIPAEANQGVCTTLSLSVFVSISFTLGAALISLINVANSVCIEPVFSGRPLGMVHTARPICSLQRHAAAGKNL